MGTVTAVAGLVLLVVGTALVGQPDFAPVLPIAALVAGAVSLGGFVLTQRYGRDPLLEWTTLTHRRFLRANGVAFVNTATTSASGTLVALVAAGVFGLTPLVTGVVLLPFSIMVVVGSLAGGFWLRRPERIGMAVGLAVVAVSMGGMAVATATRSLPMLAVAMAGLGLSWAAVTSTDAATAALPRDRQGTAAGAVNTAAQVGTAIGVAVLVTVASVVDGGSAAGGRGYVVAFAAAAGLAGAVASALALMGRDTARITGKAMTEA